MPVRAAGDESGELNGRRAVPNVIASAPWVVVLVGVAVLAVLLVVATLSFREPEQPVAWTPGPPMVLPTLDTTASPSLTATPTPTSTAAPRISAATPTTSSAPSVLPSRTSGSARAEAAPSAPAAPAEPPSMSVDTGALAADYQVTASDSGSFQAQLVVRNGTGQPVGWVVELRFTSEVTGIRASSGPGVSVSIKSAGWYLLTGVGLLDAGAQQTVRLRVSRTGDANYPAQCTVNGSACALG